MTAELVQESFAISGGGTVNRTGPPVKENIGEVREMVPYLCSLWFPGIAVCWCMLDITTEIKYLLSTCCIHSTVKDLEMDV